MLAGAVEAADSQSTDRTNAAVAIDELVAEALRNNPELKFYEAEIAAVRAGTKSAGKLSPKAERPAWAR